jgi:cell division septum initiation protein DivIVA
MSTSDPGSDTPERDRPIPLPEFERVLRGFDPRAVNSFLKTTLTRIRDLEGQVADLHAQLQGASQGRTLAAPSSADRYEMFSEHVADLVRAFDQDVERIRSVAEAEARRVVEAARARAETDTREAGERSREATTQVETMLQEARAEADRIRLDAEARAGEITAKADHALDDARARASELLSDLEGRRGSVLADMRSLREQMLEAIGSLEAALHDRPRVDDVTVAEGGVAVSEGTAGGSVLLSPDASGSPGRLR